MNNYPKKQMLSKRKRFINHHSKVICMMVCALMILSVNYIIRTNAFATNPVNYTQINVAINYAEEKAVLTAGPNGSDKFYLSTDKGKNWEMVESGFDISTLLSSKEVTILFKGNRDLRTVPFTLQADETTLKPIYQVINGKGNILINGATGQVEYRKGVNGQWIRMTGALMLETANYEVRGATIFFRTVAEPGKRAGKIVSFKIPKRPTAPAIKLDGTKMVFTGLKIADTEYRLASNSASTEWRTFAPTDTKIKTLSVAELFGFNPNSNSAFQGGIVEFRSKATDKKVASAVRLIEIPAQVTLTQGAATLIGTTLTINDSDTKKAYEYTKVERGTQYNPSTAKWTAVNSSKPVIIKNAAVQDRILIRQKSYTDKETNLVVPASTYIEWIVSSITMN